MIQISPQMRIPVAVEPIDARKGIDSLAQLCQENLAADPLSGCRFIFRSRRGTAIKLLAYDGRAFWVGEVLHNDNTVMRILQRARKPSEKRTGISPAVP